MDKSDVKTYMVFDVESRGLLGEGFAVAWAVYTQYGKTLAEECFACDPKRGLGTQKDLEWVQANVSVPAINCATPREVRERFWNAWAYAKSQGAILCAETAWPVEACFLLDCIGDDPASRQWEGPYPLLDISSVIFTAGGDPLRIEERLAHEKPEHNPIMDVRQSARLLFRSLEAIRHGNGNIRPEDR